MNGSYWDNLEGEGACHLEHGDVGFEAVCQYIRILGVLTLFVGIWALYVARLQVSMINRVAAPNVVIKPTEATSNNEATTTHKTKTSNKLKSANHGLRVTLALGTSVTVVGLNLILGNGTMFIAGSVAGNVSDALVVMYFCSQAFLSLLQVQGANWFNLLIEHPVINSNSCCFHLPSLSRILDTLQGPLGPIVSLTLWLLIVFRILSRGWCYFIGYFLNTIYGIRSFVAIATKRVATVRRVALILKSTTTGNPELQSRRQGFLLNKTTALVIDLAGVFTANVMFSASIVLLRSTFSSRRFAFHWAVIETPMVLILAITVANMHRKVRTDIKKRLGLLTKSTPGAAFKNGIRTLGSGGSVVDSSQC